MALFAGNAYLVWNHFLEGPFLHDTGWFSALVYRAGIFPKNPTIAHYVPDFYGMHVSPVISISSLFSYLVPLKRVPYFCLFEAALAAPLGAAVALLVGRDGQKTSWFDALLMALFALIFALNGQVLACIGFPHFEILISTGLCILLAGLASGHIRIAWVGLLVTVLAREDGGLHSAAFLAAAWVCDFLHRPFPVSRHKTQPLIGVAILCSVVAIVIQKTCFHPVHLFEDEYLGKPPFAHINMDVIAARFHRLFVEGSVVAYPLLATGLIAVTKRDARYLLGWLVELPWLLLNFFARQELKSTFSIYTGFPFVASIFWVGAYARANQVSPQRRYWLVPFLAVAVSASLGAYVAWPSAFIRVLKSMLGPSATPSQGILSFSANIIRQPRLYGHLCFDPGMASWALESIPAQDRFWDVGNDRKYAGYDGTTFFATGLWSPHLHSFLTASPFTSCGRIKDTQVYYCSRPGRKLPPQFEVAARP